MKTKRLLLLTLLIPAYLHATHQRAGEITLKHVSGLTYEVTIITYTYTPSPADRPELDINWGDGSFSTIKRTEKINYPNNISRNVYRYLSSNPGFNEDARHTYSSPGTYKIWLEDPNRNAGIQNIPNSVNVPLYLETILVINPFLGFNSNPVLLNPPIDNGCVGQTYIHNPGAYDIDGDSLSYRFVNCRGAGGLPVPGYQLPEASDSITINPVTGDIVWETPLKQGEFNLAFLIEEWRNGIRIGSVTRDMQIEVIACEHSAPEIQSIDDTCVEAGDTLSFEVIATDPDNDALTLSGEGGPFETGVKPAYINPDPGTGTGFASTVFTWHTDCRHVRKQPYYAFFKATDDGFPVNLVDIRTVGMTIVAPAPENLSAEPAGNAINVSWNTSVCDAASGYKLYRRNGSYGFIPGPCETGVPAYTGYTLIHTGNEHADTTYHDNNNGAGLVPGVEYCYMVTAYFPDGAESYASKETCTYLKKDLPIITNVSNDSTNLDSGEAFIAWSKPTELDTLQIPGPYIYRLERAGGITGTDFQEIAVLNGLDDTLYLDHSVNLNTSSTGFTYRTGLESLTAGFVGYSHDASSIGLQIAPTDEANVLAWQLNVPWINRMYSIYRQDPGTTGYVLIDSTAAESYTDPGLVNGERYCYYVQSTGSYNSPGFVDPLENFSPIRCAVPVDNVPPCPPELSVETVCDDVENHLTWTNPNHYCADDVRNYNIYFASTETQDFTRIHTTPPDPPTDNDTTFTHSNLQSVTGCYAVTALDSNNNESDFSNIVCVPNDACPAYELPNVFTPNGDQHNDFFTPIPASLASVDRILIRIFNRWGNVVFETTDPMINWDGKHQHTNQDCAEGVYFYVCDVFEVTLEGVSKRTIQGSVTIVR